MDLQPRLAATRRGARSLGFAVLACLLVGCEPRDLRNTVTLLFSADDQGVIAACGCPSNPSGGLAKRQELIDIYRRTRPHVVFVDAGDLMPDYKAPIKVKYLAAAVGRGAWDAIALGDQEFLLGPAALRDLSREHNLPFICANVRDETGEFIVPPHVVKEVSDPRWPGPRRIGIFAVIADRSYGYPPMEWRAGLRVEPPLEAARREAGRLAGCDLVVALSHQRLEETRELAAVKGIHVIVSGHDTTLLRKPEKCGDAIIVSTGGEGRIMGALAVVPGRQGRPEMNLELTELSAHVPDTKWVMDMYWQYVKEAKDNPPPDWDRTPIPAAYAPAETCGKCHPAEYRQWSTSHHARAYESIRRKGRQDDPECLLCHTMGLGRPGGFVSPAKTPEYARVTCQGCHIVTPDHADKKVKPEPKINIHSRLCMSCHGPVQSPDFDYFVYKPKILHLPPGTVPTMPK